MHDPMTVAFEIKYPWRDKSTGTTRLFPKGYRRSFITIWHVDPETDGSDDSCGWSRPKLSKDQQERIKSISRDEAREPWFQAYCGKRIESPTEAETLLRQAFFLVGKIFSKQHRCNPSMSAVTYEEAARWSCSMLANTVDNFRGSLAFLPGYHSNNERDRESDREHVAERFFWSVGAYILRERRPWYRHPRWHLWHWHIQIHPLEQFKRWAFSRCSDCEKSFKWGESPWTNRWDSEGPQWFRSESDVYHSGCGERVMKVGKKSEVAK